MLGRAWLPWTWVAGALAIWPQPLKVSTGSQVGWLDESFKATLKCYDTGIEDLTLSESVQGRPGANLVNGALDFTQMLLNKFPVFFGNESDHDEHHSLSELSILQNYTRTILKSIHSSKFVPWKFHRRNSSFEPGAGASSHRISALRVQQKVCPDTHAFHPTAFFDADESYEMVIEDATAIITSNHSIGTLRGLQTFQQLFYAHSSSGSYTPYLPLSIVDRPKWRHRGLSVDIARNPFQPQDLVRTMDAMAMAKLNRLHIHATDSQSWPLEIPSLPELALKGAYQPHLVWTAENLRDIQAYGAMRGISVFVEIDMPGHTASVAHAFPELITAFNQLDWSTFAAEPLSGQLKLNSPAVFEFVTAVFEDLLPRLRPYTSLYHLGGDEVNLAAYLLDETVRSDNQQILQPLLQKFMDHAMTAVLQRGFQPIVWEEMLLDWNLTLTSSMAGGRSAAALVQVWRDSQRIEEVLRKGHRVIFGDYKFWYLDCEYLLSLPLLPSAL
jgi:hexosaminidase